MMSSISSRVIPVSASSRSVVRRRNRIRSLSRSRNLAYAHAVMGLAKCCMGCAAETEGHVLEAFRLSPREARAAAQAGLAINPGFTIRRWRAAKSSDHPTYLVGQHRFCEGMRLAGVPEG